MKSDVNVTVSRTWIPDWEILPKLFPGIFELSKSETNIKPDITADITSREIKSSDQQLYLCCSLESHSQIYVNM